MTELPKAQQVGTKYLVPAYKPAGDGDSGSRKTRGRGIELPKAQEVRTTHDRPAYQTAADGYSNSSKARG